MSRSSSLSPDNILRFLQVRQDSVSAMEVSQGLHLAKNERKALFKMLLKLRKLNLIVEVAPGKYQLKSKKTEPEERKGDRKEAQSSRGGQAGKGISGRLVLHQDGYGFVIPEEPIPNIEGDIFIPRHAVEDAMHGDRVAVQIRRTGVSAGGDGLCSANGSGPNPGHPGAV